MAARGAARSAMAARGAARAKTSPTSSAMAARGAARKDVTDEQRDGSARRGARKDVTDDGPEIEVRVNASEVSEIYSNRVDSNLTRHFFFSEHCQYYYAILKADMV